MKKTELEMEDDLRDEYDLKNLRVRRLGSKRMSFGRLIVCLEPDVAEIFPNAESVNEALRFLIKAVQKNQPSAFTVGPNNTLEQTDNSP